MLFFDTDVVTDGAVGARLDGVEVLPMVSQGAAPIGPELTITAGEGRVIGELAGKPALVKLRETIDELPPQDAAADPGRAAGRDRRGLQQARLPAGRLPRARADGRRSRDRARSRSPPTSTPAKSSACTPATPRARTGTCAKRSRSA